MKCWSRGVRTKSKKYLYSGASSPFRVNLADVSESQFSLAVGTLGDVQTQMPLNEGE